MFKAITIYKLKSRINLASLEDALASDSFEPCGATQEKSGGWLPPRGQEHGAFVEAVVGQYIAKYTIEAKSVPPSVIKARVDEECAEIESVSGRKPGKRERRDLSEDARIALLPNAFPKQTAITVWINPALSYLVIDSTSRKRVDEVVTGLVKAIDGLQLQLIDTKTSPASWMAAVLSDSDLLPGDFTIDRETELKAADESKAVVKYAKHPLDIAEIREHIKLGKMPTKLAITWKDRVSFLLTENLQLKKVMFLDAVFKDHSNDNAVDDFDADVTIATGELSNAMLDLFDALGGQVDEDDEL